MPRARTDKSARLPGSQRAGTRLSNYTQVVLGQMMNGKRKAHGTLDYQNRVYQSGGEASNFVRWSHKAITLDLDAYHSILGLADTIEMVDNVRNECWRCSMTDAKLHSTVYLDPKLGTRLSIPLDYWMRFDAKGDRVLE